jgi:hypothetical protein
MNISGRLIAASCGLTLLAFGHASLRAQKPARGPLPSHAELVATLNSAIAALANGDTTAFISAVHDVARYVPEVPAVAYQHARLHALTGSADSALSLLALVAERGAVISFSSLQDSAFSDIRNAPGFAEIRRTIAAHQRPVSSSVLAFELAERDLIPEGTAYDDRTGTLFLSSFWKRKIVAIAPDGRPRDFILPGADDIGAVGGMEVDPQRRRIWAASFFSRELPFMAERPELIDAAGLYVYDVDSGRLLKKYIAAAGNGPRHALNDVTVTPDGVAYVTDSESGAVYSARLERDTLDVLLPPGTLFFPNGITHDDEGKKLFIAHNLGIDVLELATSRVTTLRADPALYLGGVDGLAYYRNTLIAHQPSAFQRVFRAVLNDAQDGVTRWEVLERHHPDFLQPTTGEVAGDGYLYIANAQLRAIRGGRIAPASQLRPVRILRLDLAQHAKQ